MSEIEPSPPNRDLAPRRNPQLVVPVSIETVHELVADATRNTTLGTIAGQYYSGWMLLDMKVRYTPIDSEQTRIELAATGKTPAIDALLFVQRRAAIHRFFIAIDDELERRKRWRPATATPQVESLTLMPEKSGEPESNPPSHESQPGPDDDQAGHV